MRLLHPPVDLNAPKGEDELEYTPLQLTRLRTSAINFQRIVIGALLLFFVGGGVAVLSAKANDAEIRRAVAAQKRSDDAERKRDQASLVGVCGITNVNRIGNQNMLADINASKPFDLNAAWPAFYDKWHDYWTPVECRALVPSSLAVHLCLQYPPTNDPETGKPTPTTADPINQKACK